ncbi:hypothetical protein [Microbacterium sp. 4NA327F11]|uniref:hypothetical protein n=1 Tax=Microbacterium sp. 4NA327F11 TaxID=2502229 RepID=UPI002016027F|nr:hypothetical protein [Microbacterium sp. 4NA327F11]
MGDEAADATMGVVMMMRMVMTVTVRVVMVVRVVVVARVVVRVAAVMPLRILGAATVCGSPRRGHELTLSAWW